MTSWATVLKPEVSSSVRMASEALSRFCSSSVCAFGTCDICSRANGSTLNWNHGAFGGDRAIISFADRVFTPRAPTDWNGGGRWGAAVTPMAGTSHGKVNFDFRGARIRYGSVSAVKSCDQTANG